MPTFPESCQQVAVLRDEEGNLIAWRAHGDLLEDRKILGGAFGESPTLELWSEVDYEDPELLGLYFLTRQEREEVRV